MFDKLKKVNDLRKAQSEMEKKMESVRVTEEKGNFAVTVNANNKIISIKEKGEDQDFVVDLLNSALKKARKKAEKKLRGDMADLGLGDLL